MNLFLTKSLFRLNPTIALAMYVPPELHEVTYFKSLSCANISFHLQLIHDCCCHISHIFLYVGILTALALLLSLSSLSHSSRESKIPFSLELGFY